MPLELPPTHTYDQLLSTLSSLGIHSSDEHKLRKAASQLAVVRNELQGLLSSEEHGNMGSLEWVIQLLDTLQEVEEVGVEGWSRLIELEEKVLEGTCGVAAQYGCEDAASAAGLQSAHHRHAKIYEEPELRHLRDQIDDLPRLDRQDGLSDEEVEALRRSNTQHLPSVHENEEIRFYDSDRPPSPDLYVEIGSNFGLGRETPDADLPIPKFTSSLRTDQSYRWLREEEDRENFIAPTPSPPLYQYESSFHSSGLTRSPASGVFPGAHTYIELPAGFSIPGPVPGSGSLIHANPSAVVHFPNGGTHEMALRVFQDRTAVDLSTPWTQTPGPKLINRIPNNGVQKALKNSIKKIFQDMGRSWEREVGDQWNDGGDTFIASSADIHLGESDMSDVADDAFETHRQSVGVQSYGWYDRDTTSSQKRYSSSISETSSDQSFTPGISYVHQEPSIHSIDETLERPLPLNRSFSTASALKKPRKWLRDGILKRGEKPLPQQMVPDPRLRKLTSSIEKENLHLKRLNEQLAKQLDEAQQNLFRDREVLNTLYHRLEERQKEADYFRGISQRASFAAETQKLELKRIESMVRQMKDLIGQMEVDLKGDRESKRRLFYKNTGHKYGGPSLRGGAGSRSRDRDMSTPDASPLKKAVDDVGTWIGPTIDGFGNHYVPQPTEKVGNSGGHISTTAFYFFPAVSTIVLLTEPMHYIQWPRGSDLDDIRSIMDMRSANSMKDDPAIICAREILEARDERGIPDPDCSSGGMVLIGIPGVNDMGFSGERPWERKGFTATEFEREHPGLWQRAQTWEPWVEKCQERSPPSLKSPDASDDHGDISDLINSLENQLTVDSDGPDIAFDYNSEAYFLSHDSAAGRGGWSSIPPSPPSPHPPTPSESPTPMPDPPHLSPKRDHSYYQRPEPYFLSPDVPICNPWYVKSIPTPCGQELDRSANYNYECPPGGHRAVPNSPILQTPHSAGLYSWSEMTTPSDTSRWTQWPNSEDEERWRHPKGKGCETWSANLEATRRSCTFCHLEFREFEQTDNLDSGEGSSISNLYLGPPAPPETFFRSESSMERQRYEKRSDDYQARPDALSDWSEQTNLCQREDQADMCDIRVGFSGSEADSKYSESDSDGHIGWSNIAMSVQYSDLPSSSRMPMLSPSTVERKETIKHRHEEYLDGFFSGLHTPDFTDEKGRPKQHLHSMYRKWKDRRVRVEQGPEMLPQINRTANHRLSTSFGALKRLIKPPRRHESLGIRSSVGSIENIVHQAPQSMQQTRPGILQYHEGTPEDPDPEYEYMISRIQEAQENVRSTLAEYDAHQAESGWEDVARDHEVFDIKYSRNESRENPARRESEVVNFTSFMVTPGMMSPHSIMFYRSQISSHSERPNAVRSPEISGQFNNQGVHGLETGYTSRGVGTDDVYEGRLTEEPTTISPVLQLPGSDRNRDHRHNLKPPLPLSKRPLLDLGTRQPEPQQRAASAEISRLPSYRTPRRISHSHASPPLPPNPAPTPIDQYTRAEALESDHGKASTCNVAPEPPSRVHSAKPFPPAPPLTMGQSATPRAFPPIERRLPTAFSETPCQWQTEQSGGYRFPEPKDKKPLSRVSEMIRAWHKRDEEIDWICRLHWHPPTYPSSSRPEWESCLRSELAWERARRDDYDGMVLGKYGDNDGCLPCSRNVRIRM